MKFSPRTLWNNYVRNLPLRRKTLLINGIALFMTTVMSVFVLIQVRSIVIDNSVANEESLVTQTANAVEASLRRVTSMMDTLETTLRPSSMEVTASQGATLRAANEQALAFENFAASAETAAIDPMITSVRLYVRPEYEYLCRSYKSKDLFSPLRNVTSVYWYGIFSGNPDRASLLCPSFYLSEQERKDYGPLAYMRKLTDSGSVTSTGPIGYIAVYFSDEAIRQLLLEHTAEKNAVYYLINSRQNIAVSSNPELSGLYYMRYQDIPQTIGVSSHFTQTEILGQSVYMTYREIPGTDWRLVAAIPRSSIYSEELGLFTLFAVIFVLVMGLLLLLQTGLSRSLTLRIEELSSRIRDGRYMRADETETPLPGTGVFFDSSEARHLLPTDKDELGHLAASYDDMLDRIRQLMEEQTETAERLKVSEVRALQAQINPHFLYNMLDMINWLSLGRNTAGVTEAIQALSRFYKMTLSRKEIQIPLQEELEHVELYAHLQNMRFEDRIELICDLPDELLECRIPKLVLQPIVENAILHGLLETEQKGGTIVIMGWEEPAVDGSQTDLVITVTDDGAGMDAETLASVLDEKTAPRSGRGGTNIAIANTHQRLRLLYGDEYGLSFVSAPGEGCEVQIRIPKVLQIEPETQKEK